METLPAQPPFHRPHIPAMSVNLQKSEFPDKTPVPTWARSLGHLLGESPPKVALSRHLPAQDQPVVSSISTLSHLRKQGLASNMETTEITPISKPVLVACQEKPTHQHAFDPVQRQAKFDIEPTERVKDIKMQKTLRESFIPKKAALSLQGHKRHLNTRLISTMEDEMNMQKRTTRQELHAMSDKGFEDHFGKVLSMHELTWDLKQKRVETGETDLKTSLANF